MKKMSQKTVSLLAAIAFMFVGLMPISAQNTLQGIVITDDVSTIVYSGHVPARFYSDNTIKVGFKNTPCYQIKVNIVRVNKKTNTESQVRTITAKSTLFYSRYVIDLDISDLQCGYSYRLEVFAMDKFEKILGKSSYILYRCASDVPVPPNNSGDNRN